jgi:Fibronectin type III domain
MINVVLPRARRSILAALLLSNLAVSPPAFATQSILLSWYPVVDPDIAGYAVYYGTSSHDYSHKLLIDEPSVVVSDLVENQTYFFAVSALNNGGLESALSDEVSYQVPPPPSGGYFGLFSEDNSIRPTSSGSFAVSVTPKGAYSGKLRLGMGRYSFTGKLDSSYEGSVTIQRRNASQLTVQFSLGTGDDAEKLFGSVSDGVWTSTLTGDRVVFNSKTQHAPFAGNYTLVIPGQKDDPGRPAGDGYGTVRVGADGIARFAGVLADKTKVSQSAPLSRLGQWPLWVPLNNGRGLLLGRMHFTYGQGIDWDGDLTWIKAPDLLAKYYPMGFTLDSHAVGSTYTVPVGGSNRMLNLTNGMIVFAGGNLGPGFTNAFVISADGKVSSASGSGLTFSFSPSSGRFSGKVTDPATGRSYSFGGAVLQRANAGYGFLLGTNQSSEVTLDQ